MIRNVWKAYINKNLANQIDACGMNTFYFKGHHLKSQILNASNSFKNPNMPIELT